MTEIDAADYQKIISQIIPDQTQDDLDRALADGFIGVRDDGGKLLFRYHPILNRVEIQRKKKKVIIDLKKYQSGADTIEKLYKEIQQQSAMSATEQGGDHGQRSDS